MNQVSIIGRLVKDPEVVDYDNTQLSHITLAVPRSYKNADGIYETDFIECILWRGIALNTAEYCKKGDLICVRGRLETSVYEKEGKNIYALNVVAEKVTFLATKKPEETKAE